MKQFSYTIEHADEIADCIQRFRTDALFEEQKSILINIFTASTNRSKILTLIHQIGNEFPTAVIAGCTTTDAIRNGQIASSDATVICFSVFQKSTIDIDVFEDKTTLAKDGVKFCEKALQIQNLAAIGILGTLNSLDIQPFLDCLEPIPKNVIIFGGGANALKQSETCIFTRGKIIEQGFLVVTYAGAELKIRTSLNFGWKPLGRNFTITKMTGTHVVETIDGLPATQIYRQYLGIMPDKYFNRDTLAFPVFVQREGKNIARHPIGFREDGSLLFIADLHEGEKIQLAYGDPRGMIEDAKVGYTNLAFFRPEGLMILSCYAHKMFLNDDVKFELAPARDIAPSHGFYTYGEIFRFGQNVGVHNMMILTIGIREGNPALKPLPVRGKIPSRLKDSMLLIERLVSFVEATTNELEHVNAELNRLARTDKLTQIANRGETEIELKKAIDETSESGALVSVLMVDIDDFKKINDTYGHDMGDRALMEIARILRVQVRNNDTVGRWGGEEFLLILSNVESAGAERIAERIRKAVSELRVLPDEKQITASFGVAQIVGEETFEKFYRRLDGALYDAKHGGKNCVKVAKKEG